MASEETLKALREKSELPIAVIIERATRVNPHFPQTHAGYLGIEEHGTRDYWKIQALADVFGKKPEEMARIVQPAKTPSKKSSKMPILS